MPLPIVPGYFPTVKPFISRLRRAYHSCYGLNHGRKWKKRLFFINFWFNH